MKLAPSRLLAIGAVMGGLLPLVVGAPAPMPDWPSHLARVWITDRVLAGDPFWTARYFFQGFFIPNAALDVGVLGLMWLGLSMNTAGSVFLVFVYAVFISGFVALSRRSGAMTALTWPLACASFYALPFIWGFVNFWLGIGSMLWVLSFWERLRTRPGQRALLGIVAAGGIGFCHVIAAGLFAGVAGCLDLMEAVHGPRRIVARLLAFLPAMATVSTVLGFAFLTPVWAYGGGPVHFRGETASRLLVGKFLLFGKAPLSNQLGPDLLVVMACVLFAVLMFRTRPAMKASWIMGVSALAIVAFVTPDRIGQGGFVDARAASVSVVLFAATIGFQHAAPRLMMTIALLLIGRGLWLTTAWRQSVLPYAELTAEFAKLPPGATMLTARGTKLVNIGLRDLWQPPITNIGALAVTNGVFVPSVFAYAGQQPLVLRPEWRAWDGYLEETSPEDLAALKDRAEKLCATPVYLFTIYQRDLIPGKTLLGGKAIIIPLCAKHNG